VINVNIEILLKLNLSNYYRYKIPLMKTESLAYLPIKQQRLLKLMLQPNATKTTLWLD
jgi:hypothetical protein